MGRRKIEIQPITHERNRSVTFVKRKNGLFKKAYELGVLCSVDVAVIIFEERAGHHLKLYQYCSSDIHDIVQRHLRHDGEKDTRGPADFSGNPANKLDDLGDGDDDEAEDDDIHRVSGKRRSDGRIKSGDSPVGVDLGYSPQLHRTMPIPAPPISLHGLPQGGGNTSSLPVSSDRHSVARNANAPPSKKPRMAEGISIPTHSESSSDDAVASASSNASGNYPYVSPTATSSFRHSSQGQYSNAFFPVSTPSPSFNVPNSFDAFNSSRGQRNSGGGAGSTSYPPRSTSYDAALYPHMVRQPSQSHGSASGTGASGGEMFSFLDAENSHGRPNPSSGSNTNFTGMDWPVHSGGHSSAPPGSGGHPSSGQPSSSSGDNTWLDFLTANPVAGGGSGGGTNASGANGRRSSDALSWERSGGRTGSTMGSPLSRSMTALGGVGGSAKRSRMGSGSGGEDETSPSSGNNGRSNGISRADITIKQEKDGGG